MRQFLWLWRPELGQDCNRHDLHHSARSPLRDSFQWQLHPGLLLRGRRLSHLNLSGGEKGEVESIVWTV